MIEICHLSSVHSSNDVRVFAKECCSLAAAGFQTTLIACPSDVQTDCVTVRHLHPARNRFWRVVLGSFQAYRLARRQRAQIYHFHDPELLIYGILLRYFSAAKVVYDSHECYPEDLLNKEWLPRWMRGPAARGFRILEDFAARRLDAVVAATPYIGKRFDPVAKKVVVINNYPWIEEFSGRAESQFARDGVCYVGAISLIRGIVPFLDSLDFVSREVSVRVAGLFASVKVESEVKGHRNWNRVEFFGQVSRAEIADIYKRSFAGIVTFLPAPNHEYSQPNKLFEYMAAGVPVIASNFELWREIVSGSECGVAIDPGSSLAIGRAIDCLWRDPVGVARMGANGRSAIATKYSWENEAMKLVKLYRELT